MSTPVVTNKWAGSLECSGSCRRKRLMAEEFSKKAMEKYRQNGVPVRCKQCVAAGELAERQAAAATKGSSMNGDSDEKRGCKSCKKTLPMESYNKNQWNKGEGKSRCRVCVEAAVAAESSSVSTAQALKLAEAQKAVDEAAKSGNPAAILKAESALAAIEAEKVTGLKPVRMSAGRGSRGGRGRGRGRGRATGGRGGRSYSSAGGRR